MARTQEDIDRENEIDNRLADHLLVSCPELAGYHRDPVWLDYLRKRAQPDRLAKHTNGLAVGIEISELLPPPGSDGTCLKAGAERWYQVYRKANYLRRSHSDLQDMLTVFGNLEWVHPERNDDELAQQIVELMLRERPSMRWDELVERRGAQLAHDYPLLAHAVSGVQMMRCDTPGWRPPYSRELASDWYYRAVETGILKKQGKAKRYREVICAKYPNAFGVKLHLLLWCKNECPPNVPPIAIPRCCLQWLEPEFAESGFDAIWYISGIRNETTETLLEPQQLYPLPPEDLLGDIVSMTL